MPCKAWLPTIAMVDGHALAGGAILMIVVLHRFLEREVVRELRNEDAWLRRELARLRADGIGLRIRGQSLRQGIPEWIAE